jgi:hypothetical protein
MGKPVCTFRHLILITVLFFNFSCTQALNYSAYETAFETFTKSGNPWMPPEASRELAWYNWNLAEGQWALAVRLAGMQNIESGRFKLAAWINPDLPPAKLWPRYDAMGSHLNLFFKEAKRLGLIEGPFNTYSDEMDALLERCAHNPAWGTWVVSHSYIRMVKRFGMERASHNWQTGKPYFESREAYENDVYLKNIHKSEAFFASLVPGAPRKVAPKNRWRHRK